jgi:taurine dioxygenase
MNAPVNILSGAPVFKHFEVEPLSPVIGGRLSGIHLSELNDESAAELREALWHYGVLFAGKQFLTPSQQERVAYYFGDELEEHTFGKTLADEGHPKVLKIEMTYSENAKTTTDLWHHDVTARPHPNIMSVLQAHEVPFGADTMWASAIAAYDRLPYALKLLFLNLDLEHDGAFSVLRHGFVNAEKAAKYLLEIGEAYTHPAVINHPFTGKLCLFIGNAYVKRVHQYPTDLSELVLRVAAELSKLPEIQIRHQWQPGDVAMWDNFGTLHYGVTGRLGPSDKRLLHRVAAWSKNVTPSLDRPAAMQALLKTQA